MACALCGGRRRDYLFVLGQTRMTRCHDCGLVSRSESDRVPETDSYALDADSERQLHAGIVGPRAGAAKRKRVLQLVRGDAPAALLAADRALEVTNLAVDDDAQGFDAIGGTYDAVFINGVVEFVRDPVAFLKHVRAHVVPGGAVVVAVASDLPRSEERLLPRHLYGPPQLIRLAMTAGFKPQSCGLLARSPGADVPDPRLRGELAFGPVFEMLERFGRKTEVPSGLLALRATATELPAKPKLSIIMPVFNEAATFKETFASVAGAKVEGVTREIIVIESNSTDGSHELVQAIEKTPDVRVIYEDRPRGKGHAVRAGIEAATGDFILIQDADSEYDVADYDIVLAPLLQLSSTFVLGSRHLGGRTWKIREFSDFKSLGVVMNLAHEGFTLLANVLYDTDMRDPTTMYKAFRRECYEGIDFKRDRFDFDWELVCKLVRRGHVPVEVPINYKSRSYSEGKKVRFFRDPLTWLTTIVSSRFERLDK
jgi:SAM-dependent methyltransferase